MVLTAMPFQAHACSSKASLQTMGDFADVFSKFEKSAWGQKLSARVSKATTTDFQRYQWAVAKTKKSQAVQKELKKLQKSNT